MGRLLLVDLGEDEDRFEQFMMPLASNYHFFFFFYSFRCFDSF